MKLTNRQCQGLKNNLQMVFYLVRRCVKAVSKIACNKKGGSGM